MHALVRLGPIGPNCMLLLAANGFSYEPPPSSYILGLLLHDHNLLTVWSGGGTLECCQETQGTFGTDVHRTRLFS